MLSTAGNGSKLAETWRQSPSEGMHLPCQHLNFGLLPPRTMREYVSVVLRQQVCTSLLRQLKETKLLPQVVLIWYGTNNPQSDHKNSIIKKSMHTIKHTGDGSTGWPYQKKNLCV